MKRFNSSPKLKAPSKSTYGIINLLILNYSSSHTIQKLRHCMLLNNYQENRLPLVKTQVPPAPHSKNQEKPQYFQQTTPSPAQLK